MKGFFVCCIVGAFSLLPLTLRGQGNGDAFNNSRQTVGRGNASVFNKGRASNFNEYRQKLNAEYVSQMRKEWKAFDRQPVTPVPDKDTKPVAPIRMSDEDARKERENQEIKIEEVVTRPIQNKSQPQPIAPVQETPEENAQYVSFEYLGSRLQVRKPQGGYLSIAGTSDNAFADAWQTLSGDAYVNMQVDCMQLRSGRKLCDWAYLMMLQALGNSYCRANSNEATLLTAFLYSQSGYKIRLGVNEGKLILLYACQHRIYDKPCFNIDGERFYPLGDAPTKMHICEAKFPKEQSLSLWVSKDPEVTYLASPTRKLTSSRYPNMSVQVSVNKNLLPFFTNYPTSDIGNNVMTRWAVYANTPICQQTKDELYPQLRSAIANCSEADAVERLLNWVQTAFVYEYDDKVWGGDRAFFPDETLYYPYCDCEDRAILFTRLVRDLLGLKCILVYYPGHLASGVCFRSQVNGDYINVNGSRFVICDPTYIGASVGNTMPNMDNASARVIVL
jgi:hypothetical protein